MIPYPIEEMRKFILAEYPNLNDLCHADHRPGALMAAILRWHDDELAPQMKSLQAELAKRDARIKKLESDVKYFQDCFDLKVKSDWQQLTLYVRRLEPAYQEMVFQATGSEDEAREALEKLRKS